MYVTIVSWEVKAVGKNITTHFGSSQISIVHLALIWIQTVQVCSKIMSPHLSESWRCRSSLRNLASLANDVKSHKTAWANWNWKRNALAHRAYHSATQKASGMGASARRKVAGAQASCTVETTNVKFGYNFGKYDAARMMLKTGSRWIWCGS